MEEMRKRDDDDGEATAVDDDVITWLIACEGDKFMAEELMKLLEDDGGGGGGDREGFRVRFIDDPYATPVIFQSETSPGYVTINGNEESCGSSFSDSDASAMASVDARGLVGMAGHFSDRGGAWGSSEVEARDGSSSRFLGEEDDCV